MTELCASASCSKSTILLVVDIPACTLRFLQRSVSKSSVFSTTDFVVAVRSKSAVVCIAYLMLVEQWSLEHACRHVLQKRTASAPRKTYAKKLRTLELEIHGRVTHRWDQIGTSMSDMQIPGLDDSKWFADTLFNILSGASNDMLVEVAITT
ncbi:hypothetical protein PF008_g11204 [Phytophthora fragariae]|uniref:Uncharacterized protein n=1 Tax=Phytophthora fragariae TaxID=53985 RepID=A0A6G0RT24_9STRA|nr:hypothetical protein PF008_g11204 [Phytophthora fragariae]